MKNIIITNVIETKDNTVYMLMNKNSKVTYRVFKNKNNQLHKVISYNKFTGKIRKFTSLKFCNKYFKLVNLYDINLKKIIDKNTKNVEEKLSYYSSEKIQAENNRINETFLKCISRLSELIKGMQYKLYIKDIISNDRSVTGEYNSYYDNNHKVHVIKIKRFLSDDLLIRSIMHEIGHSIHSEKFNYKRFNFPRADKSKYAETSYKENFACSFEDFMMNIINKNELTIRDIRIKNILSTLY